MKKKKAEREEQKKANRGNTNAGTKPPKANAAMKELDDFKAKWQGLNDMQRRGFVMSFKDDLASILDHVRQQEAFGKAA